jgi:hypothetical protein
LKDPVAFTRFSIAPRDRSGDALTMNQLRFWLDDYELHHIRGVRLVFGPQDVNRLELTLSVDKVQVDAEVLAFLELHAEKEPALTPPPQPEGPTREGA